MKNDFATRVLCAFALLLVAATATISTASAWSERGEPQTVSTVATVATGSVIEQPKPTAQASEVVNINTATAEELITLDGIGEKKAQVIIEYRERNGKFGKIEDIILVKGIGEKIFAKIRDNITV